MRATTKSLFAFGFIGLGQMGSRMAPNIFKNPLVTSLYIFDMDPASMDHVATACGSGKQVIKCNSAAEVVKRSKQIVTMLPNGNVVSAVYDTLWEKLAPGTSLIDSSTIDTKTPLRLSKKASERGAVFFDAPVSGGVNAAAAGALTFMVGCAKPELFSTVEDILKPFAKAVVNCGVTGSGQSCKLANNLILAQHMIAVSEGMLLGTRLGVDPKVLANVFNTSTGRCWSGDTYQPFPGILPNVPSSNNYKGGFGSSLMLKDLGLALEAAESVQLRVPGGASAHQVYSEHCKVSGALDFSSVLKSLDTKK